MGYIDPQSDYTLYDVVEGSLGMNNGFRPEGTIDFYGFHITPTDNSGSYNVTYDGHIGTVDRIESDDYNDVLELVDDLMRHVFRLQRLDTLEDKQELVDWAGKIITEDKERAEENPDIYYHLSLSSFGRGTEDEDEEVVED